MSLNFFQGGVISNAVQELKKFGGVANFLASFYNWGIKAFGKIAE